MTTAKPPQPPERGRVLVVDDDTGVLFVFRRILEDAGFEVVTVEDGGAALTEIDRAFFDVILCDVVMRGMGGIELLQAVRQRDLDVPVLLITGGPELSTAMKAVEHGALRYMLKPLEPGELVRNVREAYMLHALARVKREAIAHADGGLHPFGRRAALEAQFDVVLESFWMAYQPVVSWSGKRTVAYEALLRTSDVLLAQPGSVLEAAQRLDRVGDLGRAIRARVARVAPDVPAPDIFVNLHSQDLLDDDLYDPGAPLSLTASRVVLEITERSSLDSVGEVAERMRTLRALGYRIAVDDLGAGYAGLTSFTRLQPDVVKIDMSLVRGIDASPRQQRMVATMTGLCSELGMAVVCEGVETPAERDVIAGLGCDLLQGYLFAQPASGFPTPRF